MVAEFPTALARSQLAEMVTASALIPSPPNSRRPAGIRGAGNYGVTVRPGASPPKWTRPPKVDPAPLSVQAGGPRDSSSRTAKSTQHPLSRPRDSSSRTTKSLSLSLYDVSLSIRPDPRRPGPAGPKTPRLDVTVRMHVFGKSPPRSLMYIHIFYFVFARSQTNCSWYNFLDS